MMEGRRSSQGGTCPSCGQAYDSQTKRRLIDHCGHDRCYSCMYKTDICVLCKTSGNSEETKEILTESKQPKKHGFKEIQSRFEKLSVINNNNHMPKNNAKITSIQDKTDDINSLKQSENTLKTPNLDTEPTGNNNFVDKTTNRVTDTDVVKDTNSDLFQNGLSTDAVDGDVIEGLVLNSEMDVPKSRRPLMGFFNKISEKMYDLFLKACLERLQLKKSSQRKTQVRTERCLHVFEEAASCHCLSENMAIEWINILERTGQDETLKDSIKHVTTLHPTSVALWKAYLSYLVLQQNSYQEVSVVFKQALTSVNNKDSLPLWEFMYDWSIQSYPDQVESLLETGLSQCSEVCVHIKEWYLDVTSRQGDIHKTRNIYKRLSSMQPLSLTFFQKYINIENSQLKIKVKKVRSAFEDAVREYGQTSSDLWLNYINMEMEHPDGEAQNVGKLHWRAVKALESSLSDDFVTKYTLMQNGKL